MLNNVTESYVMILTQYMNQDCKTNPVCAVGESKHFEIIIGLHQ